jgi:hypothetical protein
MTARAPRRPSPIALLREARAAGVPLTIRYEPDGAMVVQCLTDEAQRRWASDHAAPPASEEPASIASDNVRAEAVSLFSERIKRRAHRDP